MKTDNPLNKKQLEIVDTSQNIVFNLEISQTFTSGVSIEIDFPISWRVFSIAMALSCSEKSCKANTKIAVAKYIGYVDVTTIKVLVQDDIYKFALGKAAQSSAGQLHAGDIIKIEYEDKFDNHFATDITKLF